MTRRNEKLPDRRVAFEVDPRASLSAQLTWLEWATGGADLRELAAQLARGRYLRALTKTAPKVLQELRTIKAEDNSTLVSWADRWGLPASPDSWALAWARTTITLTKGRCGYWCPSNREGAGAHITSEAPPSREWTPQEIAAAAPLVQPLAFTWLARFQMGATFTKLAIDAQVDGRALKGTPSIADVRRDVRRLATLIDLPLRRVTRGRASRKRHAQPK